MSENNDTTTVSHCDHCSHCHEDEDEYEPLITQWIQKDTELTRGDIVALYLAVMIPIFVIFYITAHDIMLM